ncbi:MAG: lactate racemase domain-containing protein [Planctomycetota bacterium]|jgi:nickel-dependent lactate racemase|nr:lactate racemase domain-containing protein [Planctomycetota bacterium]
MTSTSGLGHTDRLLTDEEISTICQAALDPQDFAKQRILLIVPDHTRTCPLDRLFRQIHTILSEHVAALDVLIALGTHPPLTQAQINERVGITEEERQTTYKRVRFYNHEWATPEHLVEAGQITEDEISDLTEGRFAMTVSVTCNKLALDYDRLLIVGPVFPHEVAGFSGGNKYICPGIAGKEIIDFFHWLGAIITNPSIIGHKWTPVRQVIDRAAALLPTRRQAFCMVVKDGGLAGLFFGNPEDSWSAAADLSAQLHIHHEDRAYSTVLSCAPTMYDELWVAGKCMYKLEPIVADGGQLIIYGPHITQISETHGRVIEEIGYHTRDYFLDDWDRFQNYPWGVVAHSTHVKGIGSFKDGIEKPRIEVILATGIPEDVCHRINLGYMDPGKIDPADYQGREAEGILCVPHAGERLYRLKDGQTTV